MEVEVKYRVGDPSGVTAALAARGIELSAPFHQDDQAYARDGWHRGLSRQAAVLARLRTQGGRHLFTVKRAAVDGPGRRGFEAEVADRSQMHEAILQMGFYPTVRVGKVRRTARLGEMTLCLDDVEHLGSFLRIAHVIAAGRSGAALRNGLDTFARSLGVPLQPATGAYHSLLRAALAAV